MDGMVQGPIFSPITTEWTLGFPSHAGASNWGGLAADSRRQTLAFHIQSLASRTKLIPRTVVAAVLPKLASWDPAFDLDALDRGAYQPPPEAWAELKEALDVPPEAELAWQRGTSHFMARYFPMAPLPCGGAPFNEVVSFDLAKERPRFRQPHGQDPLSKRLPLELGTGMIGQGGPLLTAGGVLFLGASADERFRAYDAESGALLWEHALPYSGLATPMAYAVQRPNGDWQSFVVIAAGGDARLGAFGGGGGDFLVAFALPSAQEN
jgi:quinoprotein glucose dehydrogenase